jgi:hypothetical protein
MIIIKKYLLLLYLYMKYNLIFSIRFSWYYSNITDITFININHINSCENGVKLLSNVAVYGDIRPTRDHSSALGVSRIREKEYEIFCVLWLIVWKGMSVTL